VDADNFKQKTKKAVVMTFNMDWDF
jgi:hypothetical protein